MCKLKNFGQLLNLKLGGIDLYAGLKICHQSRRGSKPSELC